MTDHSASTAPTGRLLRSEAGIITAVDDGVVELLGWQPEQLIGSPSTSLIHPEDQPGAIAAWFEMLADPGATNTWEGRYRTASGDWRWVRVSNTNQLENPDVAAVVTVIQPSTVDRVGLAEELRARKQVMSRLADALPLGVFQFDADRTITFANDRLHVLLGRSMAASVDAMLAGVLPEDRPRLDDAIAATLSDLPVDEVELRFRPEGAGPEDPPRVCELSLRPLTDDTGRVSGAIGCLSDVTERVRLRRDLQLRASVDTMTGCLNRDATLELLAAAVVDARESGEGLAVVYADLDDFKRINDDHGHTAGDAVLVAAAAALRAVIRDGDEVGRLGGDEFLIVIPRLESAAAAAATLRRLRHAATGEVEVHGVKIPWQASLGLAYAAPPDDTDVLISQADRAMYAEKRRRKQQGAAAASRLPRPRSAPTAVS